MSEQKPKIEKEINPEREQNTAKWFRGIYVLLFFFLGYIACFVVVIVSVLQFLSNVFFNKNNAQLLNFGQSLSIYGEEIIQFITYNSEEKPFPFKSWPK